MDVFKKMSLGELKGWEKKWQELGQNNIGVKIIDVFWWNGINDGYIQIGEYIPENEEEEKKVLKILERTFEKEENIIIGRR